MEVIEAALEVERLRLEHLVADLDGPTAGLVVERDMLAKNFAKLPRRVLGATLDALLIQKGYSVHQPAGLFLGRRPVNAYLLRAARAALTLLNMPDTVAFVAGDKRVLNSLVGLDGLDGWHGATTFLLRFAGFSLDRFQFQFFITV